MNLEIINYPLLFIAALIPVVVGMLWYSRFLFGKRWMQLENITPEMEASLRKQPMAKKIVVSYITYLFISYALVVLVNYLVIAAIMPAITLAIVIWLGFMVPAAISDYVWSPNRKAWGVYYIHIGYFLVSVVLMSLVIALWA